MPGFPSTSKGPKYLSDSFLVGRVDLMNFARMKHGHLFRSRVLGYVSCLPVFDNGTERPQLLFSDLRVLFSGLSQRNPPPRFTRHAPPALATEGGSPY